MSIYRDFERIHNAAPKAFIIGGLTAGIAVMSFILWLSLKAFVPEEPVTFTTITVDDGTLVMMPIIMHHHGRDFYLIEKKK